MTVVSESTQGSAELVRDASSSSYTRTPTLSIENPWPGLAAYDEASRDFFHGRIRETDELLRLIRLAPLTTLYGKSGLGKSSLLQAGLFPSLRKQHFAPVYLRIDFSNATTAPLEQVALRLDEELARSAADFPRRGEGEDLWEYLHREHMEIWSSDNFPLIPVLVFDQFEELFSGRVGDVSRIQQARNSLADLIENRIPAELATEEAKSKRSRLNLFSLQYRIVISCREDYLPDLKSWEKDVPSLLRNCLRLEPMTRQCAIEAVERSGQTVLAHGVAPSIVDFVGRINGGENKNTEAIIEPVLLCLCCYQLNRRRKGNERIDKELVESAGADILESFYRTALDDKDVRGPPDVAAFIETFLVQGDRFRGSYPKAEAIVEGLLKQVQLDALTDRLRLLRVVQHTDTARIELIHDRLIEVVCKTRDERKLKERQAERERLAAVKNRRVLGAATVFALALLVLGGLFYRSYGQWQKARAWATLDSVVTGRRYLLTQDIAPVGRPTDDDHFLVRQVPLKAQSISRLHLMIFPNFYALDMRSRYGTTINSEFLPYGSERKLNDGDMMVLAGVAAFQFHPLTYRAWNYFWRLTVRDALPRNGWALLIDGSRRLTFPVKKEKEFIVPEGEGVKLHEQPEGAIAIVRRRSVIGEPTIASDSSRVKLFEKAPEDPEEKEIRIWRFPESGATGQSFKLNRPLLTIENVTDNPALEADLKLSDYAYGRFVVPRGKEYYCVSSGEDCEQSPGQLAFHQGGRRFQVIALDPNLESHASDNVQLPGLDKP
jgi:hypothetical protein